MGMGTPYFPGCDSVLAFDSAFNAAVGTCSATSYSVNVSTLTATGSRLVIVTWAAGANGTPTNQPATFVFTAYDNNGSGAEASTCLQDFTAHSGPLAVTLNRLNATVPTGGMPMALAAMAVMAAGVVFSGRRIRRRAQDVPAA